MYSFRCKRAFTLIELLVVISIISFLSSIVLSALNGARENARASAGKKFSFAMHNAFGADAALVWNFDESSGTTEDLSGNGNNGTLVGSPSRSTDTPYSRGNSISLNGSSQYVTTPTSPSLDVSSQITLSAWIKPTVIGGNYKVIMAKRVSSNSTSYELYLGNNDGVLSYYNGTQYRSTFVPKVGVWTHVAVTLNGGKLVLYADGAQVYSATGVTGPAVTTGAFSVGVAGGYINEYFQGYIDDVRVYTQSLAARDVEAIYAQGAARIQLAGNP